MTALVLLAVVLTLTGPLAYVARRRLRYERRQWAAREAHRLAMLRLRPVAEAFDVMAVNFARAAQQIGATVLPAVRNMARALAKMQADAAATSGVRLARVLRDARPPPPATRRARS